MENVYFDNLSPSVFLLQLFPNKITNFLPLLTELDPFSTNYMQHWQSHVIYW